MFFKKKKSSVNHQDFMLALKGDKCDCFFIDCECFPHGKLLDISGGGKNYFWNDGGVLVFGTEEELKAAINLYKDSL